ncbi:putative S-locus lectin protein kinase family protein [Abeliophyllum distichum]|uniref:S-locus lectin protein kinase family protein n=1 Tax=Abeliophyllum distichum TaxID=126358 RepID=A0ABD1RX11_9LAMI
MEVVKYLIKKRSVLQVVDILTRKENGAMPRAKKSTQEAGPSSGKRKAPSKRSSKQPATYDDTKFETEDTWLAYKHDISRRTILPERRVLTSDFANELLGHVIARNQWESFVATPRVAYVEIVKEFYAKIHENLDNPDHPQYRQVYVRGQYIPFSPMEILRYYGLEDMEADIFQATHTDPHEVATSLCHGIDHWPEGSSTLDYRSLLPQIRTLDKMVSANLLPTSHTSTVTMERARLLHWLQTKTLHLGNYIFCNIWHIRNNRRCLAFPSLITGICALNGIDLSQEITTVKRTMQIDRIGIRSSELHIARKLDHGTQDPLGGQDISAGVSGPALDDPMPEDPPPPATEPTLASISHDWHASHAALEAQIREIRETQVHEIEVRRREHEVLSAQMAQLLSFFSLYPPPPPQ